MLRRRISCRESPWRRWLASTWNWRLLLLAAWREQSGGSRLKLQLWPPPPMGSQSLVSKARSSHGSPDQQTSRIATYYAGLLL